MNGPPPPDDDGSVLGTFRTAPHNVEAEKALLGAILIANHALDAVADVVRPEHFAIAAHGRCYELCVKLIDGGGRADPITLKPYFESEDVLIDIGGPRYLAELLGSAVTIIQAGTYGRLIRDLYLKRQIIGIGEAVATRGYTEADASPAELVEELDAGLAALAGHDPDESERDPAEQMAATINGIEERRVRKGLPGRSTGLVDLDNLTGGLEPAMLYVLAARPSMGKSALAINVAEHVCHDVPILFVSLEMAAEQINRRRLAAWAEVDYGEIRRGEVSDADAYRLHDAAAELADRTFYIDDRGGLTVAQIRRRALRLLRKAKTGLGLLVVDHIQLIRPDDARANRVHQIEQVTNGLKVLAKELAVPVLALSQLNRGVENRDDKRPELRDLRESGTIEQDADGVAFLYREHYYAEKQKPQEEPGESDERFEERVMDWRQRCEGLRRKAEVIVAKQRENVVGTVDLVWRGEFQKFSSTARV